MSGLRSILKTDDIVAYTLRKEATMKYLLSDINEVDQEDLESVDATATPCSLEDDWNFCICQNNDRIRVCIYISYIKSLKMIKPYLDKLNKIYDANLNKNITAYQKIVHVYKNTEINPIVMTPTILEFEISGNDLDYVTFHHNRTTERISVNCSNMTSINCYYNITFSELYHYFN